MTDEEMKNALNLIKENEELKERLRIESQSLHELYEIVSKQVEQIEKKKCCANCKYAEVIEDYEPCNRCSSYIYWELAE